MNTQRTIRRLLFPPFFLLLQTLFGTGSLPAQENPFPPASAESQGIAPEAIESLHHRIQRWLEEDRIVGGELLVIKNRRTVMHSAFGWNDREGEEEMEPNTLFNIRSMTKPLVGTAIQLLMEEGRLVPKDRVAKFLPTFDTEAAGEITIEQLLTHRSGLPVSVVWNPENPPSSLRAHARAIAEAGPQLEPGSRFWYSDAGADVLAALVEAASGELLETFMEARLFDPLGMEDTGFMSRTSEEDLPLNRVASLYGGTAGSWQRFWQSADEPLYPFPMGSQSVYSTPMDYARFLGMWMDGGIFEEGQLLPEATVRRILTPREAMTQIGSTVPFPTGFPGQEVWHGEMAMLWREAEEADGPASGAVRAFGYSGSDGTFAWGWPEETLMVLFFTQSRGQNIHLELESLLHSLVSDGENPAPTSELQSVPEAFLPFLGRYQADSGPQQGTEFTVLFQDGALAVDIPGQTVFALNEPDEGGWRSFVLTDQVSVRFQEDPSGRVEAMELAQTSVFPRGAASNEPPAGTPEDLIPLLGEYLLPGGQGVLEVYFEAETLSVRDPNGRIIPLSAGEAPGVWLTDDTPPKPITFPTDPQGRTMAMTLREVMVLPKVEVFGKQGTKGVPKLRKAGTLPHCNPIQANGVILIPHDTNTIWY